MNTEKAIVFDLATDGLDPFKHRIIGITAKTDTDELIITDSDEKKILHQFWSLIRENGFNKMVGFNSDNFDIPMLVVRSIKNKIQCINISDKIIDLRKVVFGNIDKRRGKLIDFKDLMGMPDVISGYAKMHMTVLWGDSKSSGLRDKLLEDVRITWNLYCRVKECGLV